jgi:hypothetical protein
MRPTEPGRYPAREIHLGLAGTKMLSAPHEVEVVADVPNPRGHKLLVATSLKQPRYKSLDCYEWP